MEYLSTLLVFGLFGRIGFFSFAIENATICEAINLRTYLEYFTENDKVDRAYIVELKCKFNLSDATNIFKNASKILTKIK